MTDQNFICRHKKGGNDFIRNRVPTFKITVVFLMSIIKDSVQNELDYFFGRIERSGNDVKKVTNRAFAQARAKLNNHRLVAIDGSSIVLPRTDEIEKKFGRHYEKAGGAAVILARISEDSDPLNHISLDVQIQPYAIIEHKMLIDHLDELVLQTYM